MDAVVDTNMNNLSFANSQYYKDIKDLMINEIGIKSQIEKLEPVVDNSKTTANDNPF